MRGARTVSVLTKICIVRLWGVVLLSRCLLGVCASRSLCLCVRWAVVIGWGVAVCDGSPWAKASPIFKAIRLGGKRIQPLFEPQGWVAFVSFSPRRTRWIGSEPTP